MMRWDPALIVSLSAARDSRPVSANNTDLVSRIDRLGAARRGFCALAALATTFLLRKESGNPRVIYEVGCSSEGRGENKIKEDAGEGLAAERQREQYEILHLRIEDAERSLYHTDSLVEDLQRVNRALLIPHYRGQIQPEILRVHLRRERVRQTLRLASGDFDSIFGRGQILDDLVVSETSRPERAANIGDGHGSGLVIGE